MIPWFKGTIKIQQYAESGKFIILEVTHHKGKLYKVIEQVNPEDYKVRFAGSLKKCADWANSHGANFLIYGICGGRYSIGDCIYKDTDSVKLPESCPEVAPELPQVCQNCKWFLPGAKKCQLKDAWIVWGDPACVGCGLYESED